jgi:hypothetical protein
MLSNMQAAWPSSVGSDAFRTISCTQVRMKDKFYSKMVKSASTVKFCKHYLCYNVLHMYYIVTFCSGKFPKFNSGRWEKSMISHSFLLTAQNLLKWPKMRFGCLNVILFHSDHWYVSATNVAIFRVVRKE